MNERDVLEALDQANQFVAQAEKTVQRMRGLMLAALVLGFLLGYVVSDWVDALGRVTG